MARHHLLRKVLPNLLRRYLCNYYYVVGQAIIFFAMWFLSFMAALCNRVGHIYFHPVFFSFFFSSPNLSGQRLDVYHTSTHGVALV